MLSNVDVSQVKHSGDVQLFTIASRHETYNIRLDSTPDKEGVIKLVEELSYLYNINHKQAQLIADGNVEIEKLRKMISTLRNELNKQTAYEGDSESESSSQITRSYSRAAYGFKELKHPRDTLMKIADDGFLHLSPGQLGGFAQMAIG